MKINLSKNDEEINILNEINNLLINGDPSIRQFLENNVYHSGCKNLLRSFLDSHKGVIAVEDHTMVYNNAINIGIGIGLEITSSDAYKGRKYTDKLINSPNRNVQVFGITKEVARHASLKRRMDLMQSQIDHGEIHLIPNFKRDGWPTHPLMNYIKTAVTPIIEAEVRNTEIICDPQDIRYQTLFRLTTIPINDIVYEGDELQSILLNQGSFSDWKRIPNLNQLNFDDYPLKEDTIQKIIQEQLIIIKDRLSQSRLPIEDIVTPSGIFASRGWEIVKNGNDVIAFNRMNNQTTSLEFREIDPAVAIDFHNDLHYIHSPRADFAFGFYLKGEELPFSVLSAQRLDRDYKKNVLLAHGFDPDNCLDFTRLYSRPGTPLNTSTAIMGSVYEYLRQNYSNIQAGISAFMPTYATGLSMVSGGFETPVMVKTGKHKFQKRQIDGLEVWEHVTSRRQSSEEDTIESTFPMLPTVELMLLLRKPRFQALRGISGKIVDLMR